MADDNLHVADDPNGGAAHPQTDVNVVLPGGKRMSEEDWSKRDDPDAPKRAVQAARKLAGLTARQEDKSKAAEEHDTEHLVYSTADNVDRPGQSAGGALIVRKGESLEDVSVRRDEEKHNAESDRVNAALDAAMARKALEEGQG